MCSKAPYNNQMNAIRKALDQAGFEEVRVGTFDKFQGQEGMIVIVSLACSSADDAPRGLDFLLDRNRFNVASGVRFSIADVERASTRA